MTSQVNTTLGTNGKAQSKSSTLVCTSHSPHSRLFHEVHIFCCSIFCMRKLTLCNKLDHSSASHMLAKHKFYSLTSTQFLWDHQFRRILLKLLKKCDIIRLKYFFPSWLMIAWRILFWEKLKTLSLTIPQWFKIPTKAKMLYMSKPIHMPPI